MCNSAAAVSTPLFWGGKKSIHVFRKWARPFMSAVGSMIEGLEHSHLCWEKTTRSSLMCGIGGQSSSFFWPLASICQGLHIVLPMLSCQVRTLHPGLAILLNKAKTFCYFFCPSIKKSEYISLVESINYIHCNLQSLSYYTLIQVRVKP